MCAKDTLLNSTPLLQMNKLPMCAKNYPSSSSCGWKKWKLHHLKCTFFFNCFFPPALSLLSTAMSKKLNGSFARQNPFCFASKFQILKKLVNQRWLFCAPKLLKLNGKTPFFAFKFQIVIRFPRDSVWPWPPFCRILIEKSLFLLLQALLVISALVVMATADKPDHQPGSKSSKEVTSSSEVKKQAKLPTAKRVNIRRKVPSQLQSRLHRFARKLPLHKAFVNSARTARKIAGTAAKRVQKVQKRKRVQKAKPKQAFKRPVAVNKVNNFGRFLKAFARQFDRPVQ